MRSLPTRSPKSERENESATRALAVVGDLHGNIVALEAVLQDLRARAVERIVVAGDLLLPDASREEPSPDPVKVWFRLQEVGADLVRGVSDTALATVDPSSLTPKSDEQHKAARRFAQTRTALGEFVLARIARLPERLRYPLPDGSELVVVHGSPRDPTQEIGHDLDEEEIRALVGDDPADYVFCAATHVPFQRDFGDLRVVNVGSVGAAPEGRVAHVTLLRADSEGVYIEQTTIDY